MIAHVNVDTTLNVCRQVVDGAVRRALTAIGNDVMSRLPTTTVLSNCTFDRGKLSVPTEVIS